MGRYMLVAAMVASLVTGCGRDGQAGSPGAPGTQGDDGPVGVTGPEGPDGVTGPSGPLGPKGATGATGPEGPEGPIGVDGPMGATGPTGPQGPNGQAITGATGPTGPMGPVGIAGPTGPTGAVGPTGAALDKTMVYEITVTQAVNQNGSTGTADAKCIDANDVLLSGGCTLTSPTQLTPKESRGYFSSDTNTIAYWRCVAYNFDPSFPHNVQAHAYCMTVP